ncbi:MAG: hypothetical protein WD225_07740 [Ilumatobacteraceae bacterium]
MSELDDAVHRIADVALDSIRRIGGYVSKLAVVAIVAAVGGLLLGMSALEGGARTVWIVLAVLFGWFSLSRVIRLRWNIAKLVRNRVALEHELGVAIGERSDSERAVIDVGDGTLSDETAMQIWTEEFVMTSRGVAGNGDYRWIPLAVRTAKQFGGAAIVTTLVTTVFVLMALIFLVALALD